MGIPILAKTKNISFIRLFLAHLSNRSMCLDSVGVYTIAMSWLFCKIVKLSMFALVFGSIACNSNKSNDSHQSCRTDDDCKPGYRCAMVISETQCVPIAETKPLGGPCTSNSDCDAGLICHSEWPSGMCVGKCDSGEICGPISICLDDFGSQPFCVPRCMDDSECRLQYICTAVHDANACLPINYSTD